MIDVEKGKSCNLRTALALKKTLWFFAATLICLLFGQESSPQRGKPALSGGWPGERDVGRVGGQHPQAPEELLRRPRAVEAEPHPGQVVRGQVHDVEGLPLGLVAGQVVHHVLPQGEAGALLHQGELDAAPPPGPVGFGLTPSYFELLI